jgi:two-component sensor histidine kinase
MIGCGQMDRRVLEALPFHNEVHLSMSRQSTTPPIWDTKHLRIATDAARIALWSWNVDTDEIALDERSHLLWGLPLQDGFVTFETLSARIHPEDLDRVRAAFASTREMFGDYELEFRILRERDVRWIAARGRGDDEGIVGRIMFGVFLDVTERKLAEESRELIAGEMSHRVKNLFAIASALTRIASRSATTTAEMAHDITRRLHALGQAHELIRPSLSKQKKALQLGELLGALLAAYDEKGTVGDRIAISVADVLVGEAAITTVALVIHELATNSIKYGALSSASGSVDISCSVEDGSVNIVWRERGGPPLTVPRGQAGFGSNLIHKSITGQLGGSITFDWPTDGAIVTLRVSKALLGA